MNLTGTKKVDIYLALFYRLLILLAIYSFLRIGFYLSNIDLFQTVTLPKLGIMMLGGLKFDIAALLYINGLFIVLQGLPFPFRFRKDYQLFSKWLFIITNSIGIALNII